MHKCDTTGRLVNFLTPQQFSWNMQNVMFVLFCSCSHSGETDEANCSWLHPVWPPLKRPDQDSTFCVVSRASSELMFCIHRDFDVRNNVCKPRRIVCEYCRDISAWKSQVMKPTVGVDLRRMKPTEYGWSQLHICDELQSIAFGCLLSYNIWL